jgi:hypothetical protein
VINALVTVIYPLLVGISIYLLVLELLNVPLKTTRLGRAIYWAMNAVVFTVLALSTGLWPVFVHAHVIWIARLAYTGIAILLVWTIIVSLRFSWFNHKETSNAAHRHCSQ